MEPRTGLQNLKTGGNITWEIVCLFGFALYVYLEKLFRLFVARPLKSLEGEVILLTGAGNGIGKQIAFQLANVGATLICWDNETAANEQTVTELKKNGTKAFAYTVDLSDRVAIQNASQTIRDEHGDVTVIINNAGFSPPPSSIMNLTPQQIEKTFEVNLFAHFWIIREFLPSMLNRNHGHIVTTASLSSFVPTREFTAYVSSKHGVHGFIDSLKQEISYSTKPGNSSKIHFTTVYPIAVSTRMLNGITFQPKYYKFPIVTPEYIAQKTVEGFRQNYEHLCLPPVSVIMAILVAVLPASIMDYLNKGLLRTKFERSDDLVVKNGSNSNSNGKKAN